MSTEVENGILVIGIKNKDNKKLNFKKLLVTIEAPNLSSVRLSSGSLLTTLNLINEYDFKADISSGANLNANLNVRNKTEIDISSGSSMRVDLKTKNIEFAGSSGSMATLNGTAENIAAKLSSAAALNAQNMITQNATVAASSGANLKINVTDNLTAAATSGASIRYKGNPKNVIMGGKTSSGGSVKSEN